jgi:hypothetical protein
VVAPARLAVDRPDVLLCTANVVPLLARCPTVPIHDLPFLRHAVHRTCRRRYLSALTALSTRRATRIVTVSQFTRDEVLELLGIDPARVIAILNGLDESFGPADPGRLAEFCWRRKLPPRFLRFLRTLEPRKNVATLIRAGCRRTSGL